MSSMQRATADRPRRPAADLIAAVVDTMRRHLEPLKYSTLAPSHYVIYVHPSEFARLEGILPRLHDEAIRALAEATERLNSPSRLRRCTARLIGDRTPPVQPAGGAWHVQVLPDPDGELAEGDILIDSELLLPAQPELGVGERTRRITTMHAGQQTSTRERTAPRAVPDPAPRPLATIAYADESGRHSFEVLKDSVTIGRGGTTYPVDLRIVSSVDVSREHARLRRDAATGRFFLIDLSSLGTTLNARHIPRGYDEVNGTKRENGVETPLPDAARIGLAETVFLDFRAGAR